MTSRRSIRETDSENGKQTYNWRRELKPEPRQEPIDLSAYREAENNIVHIKPFNKHIWNINIRLIRVALRRMSVTHSYPRLKLCQTISDRLFKSYLKVYVCSGPSLPCLLPFMDGVVSAVLWEEESRGNIISSDACPLLCMWCSMQSGAVLAWLGLVPSVVRSVVGRLAESVCLLGEKQAENEQRNKTAGDEEAVAKELIFV